MAMYHFRLKSDKKPNGTKISAVQHVEYINREGKFSSQEQWQEKNKFVGNFITTEKTPNAFGGQDMLLYKTDDYGSIRNSAQGIEVTEKASAETIAIALVLASHTMNNQPLILHGSSQFKKATLKTAIQYDLPISFDDILMQKEFLRHKSLVFPDRKKFALETAHKILKRPEKKEQTNSESHLEYINRERAFENRGECIFHSHHLPKWAKDDPKKFFHAADKYEGVGHRRFVEIEFALPNELKTVDQYRQIIEPFIEKHLSEHYYAYAIHDKIGMLSDGQRHPHVHIMFSERLIDDVEKTKERAANAFFLYPARKKKDGSEPSFQEKWKRGAPKDRKWCNHQYITDLRGDFAQIQNHVLERNGFSVRVDHRTLQAQKENAEKVGDSCLARIFNRSPEEYVGVISCLDDDNPHLQRLREFRSLRKQHFDLILNLDAISKEKDELEIKDNVHLAIIRAKNFISSQEFIEHKFASQYQQELKTEIFSAIAEVNKWKRLIISQHVAEEQAKFEYMTKVERQLWQKYFETLAQKKHLEDFLKTLHKPDDLLKDAIKAYNDIVDNTQSKIFSFTSEIAQMKKSIEEIEKRLEEPDCKKNILLVTHQILQSNLHARKMLKQSCEQLDRAVDSLRNEIFVQTISDEPKNIFKTREVYDLIRQQFSGLKKEYEQTLDQKINLRRRIISPQRAIAMAKNIFVHGDFKKLRADLRQYKKDEQRLARKLADFNYREKIFQSRDWSTENRSAFLQEKYWLTKEKTLLGLEHSRLDNLKLTLEQKQNELESLCQKPDAVKKIDEIAAGILRKNSEFVRQMEKVETQAKELNQRMNHVKEQLDALKIRLNRDKANTCYKIISPDNSATNEKAASLIADAILFDPQAVQLVARSIGNNLEMEKDWEMMTDFDKDEIIRKKIIREL